MDTATEEEEGGVGEGVTGEGETGEEGIGGMWRGRGGYRGGRNRYTICQSA